MTTVTQATPQQINAALNSLKSELQNNSKTETKTETKTINSTTTIISEGSGTATLADNLKVIPMTIGMDLNSCTTYGRYSTSTTAIANGLVNAPSTVSSAGEAYLEVDYVTVGGSTYCKQILTLTMSGVLVGMYERVRTRSAWVAWNEIITARTGTANKAKLLTGLLGSVKWYSWSETGAGFFTIPYEGQDVTTYKLPESYVEIYVNRPAQTRGTAYAIVWNNGASQKTVYINTLHDDTASDAWSGWTQINANKANRIVDSSNGNSINVTYGKAGQSSTNWLASWNGYELGAISPSNVSVGSATNATNANITKTTDSTNGDKLQIGSGTAVNITNAKNSAYSSVLGTSTVGYSYNTLKNELTSAAKLHLTLLWSGTFSTTSSSITLSDSIDNYSGILLCWQALSGEQITTMFIPKSIYYWSTTATDMFLMSGSTSASTRRMFFYLRSSTPKVLYSGSTATAPLKYVYGVL